MTEREIQLLGLQREEIKEHDEDDSYYYVMDIVDGLALITPANDEIKDGNWYFEFFETDTYIRFTEFGELQELINLLHDKINSFVFSLNIFFISLIDLHFEKVSKSINSNNLTF
jgi:hypothetical protein